MSSAIDRFSLHAPIAAQVPTSSGSGTTAAVIIGTRTSTRWSTATTHNARYRRAPFLDAFWRVCPKSVGLIIESGDFPVEFAEGDGLKTRCRFERKSWIRQVLISRTLTVYGEVAERLKAAVC